MNPGTSSPDFQTTAKADWLFISEAVVRVGHLEILPRFFALPRYITPAIKGELEIGLRNGVAFLKDALQRH